MARTARGAVTLIDVNDGANPITAYLTNENHTFAATSAGVVSGVSDFSTNLTVFVGGTQATYNTTTSTPNTFRITSVAYQGTSTGWGTPTANAMGVVTIPSIGNSAVASTQILITFSVTNENGNVNSGLTAIVTLSVVREGSGGAIVSMIANRQDFRANNAGTLNDGQSNIIFTIDTQGNTGNLVVQTSIDGAAFVTQTTTGTGAGNIAAYDVDTSGNVETTGSIPNAFARLAVSSANLGNAANTLAVRVAGATGGQDTISIAKVRDGAEGAAAIIVNVSSDSGTVFRNAAGAAKVLTATVFDAADGTQITTGVTYNWSRSGSGSVPAGTVRVNSAMDRTVVPTGGVEANGTAFNTITVGPEDTTASEQFTCEVTVSD